MDIFIREARTTVVLKSENFHLWIMDDLTDAILSGQYNPTDLMDDGFVEIPPHIGLVTCAMLNRRPEIKQILLDQLQEFILSVKDIFAEDKVEDAIDAVDAEVFTDEQIVNALNSDPQIQMQAMEILLYMHDRTEDEGPPFYRPSIFSSNDAEYLSRIVGNFQEEHDEIPAKYDHLKKETLDIIYGNPEIRATISRIKGRITDEMVAELSGNR